MKSFNEFMTENGHAKSLGGDGGAQNQYGRWGQEPVHMGVHRIEDPNVLQRLNAHVGLINTREYIDPRSALEHVQNALSRLGYHFEYNMNDMPNEQNVYPLNRFGGRTGFLDMDAVVKEDDGIEASVGESMVLRVEFVQDSDTSRYEVFAQIVPASLFDEEDVQPEAIKPNRAGVPSTTGDADGINMGESIRISMRAPTTFWKASVIFDEFDDNGIRKFADNAELKDWDPTVFETQKGVTVEVTLPARSKSAALSDIKKQIPRSSFSESVHIEEIGEAVSISMAHEKGQGTFEVTFDFRGGPTKRQAQKFALAAQKKLAGATFTPNRKGNSETVVVTVKASSPRDAQVKARKVLDENVGVDQIFEAQKFIVSFPTKTLRNQALSDVQKLPSGLRTVASALFPGAGPANGVFFSVSDNGTQTRDLMKLIKKARGTVSSQKVEEIVNEELSRTFAFPTSDARDRIEKLLGLASREPVTTSNKGSGKFKFTVTAMLKSPQIAKIMNSVKQVKGIVSVPTTESTFDEMTERLRQEDIQPQQPVAEAAMLSRTFAFPTSDARDRIEKLFGLATGETPTTSDKGKGKFKFTVTGELKGAQIDRIMNSVKQLKGVALGGSMNEELSRTFAFATADARDRIEKLLGLATRELVSTSDKGKGKFKFQVSAMIRSAQLSKIMNSVKQLKGITEENSPRDMANNAVRSAILERAERLQESDPARSNQLKVARDTLKMNPVFQKVMGGPSKKEAIKILMSKGTSADKKLAKKAMNESSAFIEAGLQNAREAVKGGKQFVSVSGRMSEKKANQTIRGAAKFLMQHGTPADKKLAKKVLVTEIRRTGGQDVLSDPEGNVVYKIDVSLDRADRQSNRGVALANEVKKAGYKFGPGFDVNDFGQGDGGSILVNDAKNPTDARKKIKRLIGKARVKAIISSLNIFKEMAEGVQIFPASPRFSGPLRPKPGKFGETFDVEVGFSSDDWKRLAPLVRKAATKAKWKTFEIRSDKVLRVVLKDKDAKTAQKRVSDLVDGVKKSIGVKEDHDLSHDDNAKENRRTRKDNKLASGFSEGTKLVTVVAIKNNKVVGQIHSIAKNEIKTATEVLKKDHPGAKVSVENQRGRVVSVEAYTDGFKEQISKKKKKTTSY